jgi:hypothetical protein
MAYGHAERGLTLVRQLEAETRQLLEPLDQPDPEQSAWPQEATSRDPVDVRPPGSEKASSPLAAIHATTRTLWLSKTNSLYGPTH